MLSLFDNSRYVGMFVRDNREGEGYLLIDGMEEYKGRFSENKKNGHGIQSDLMNNQRYDGTFLNDERHGNDCRLYVFGKY